MRSTHYNWRYHSLYLSSLKNVIDAKMNFMSNVTHLSNVTEKSPLNLGTQWNTSETIKSNWDLGNLGIQ